jgi:predicted ATPase/DNA-binding winged helix-turn-helix (wHTH) protein
MAGPENISSLDIDESTEESGEIYYSRDLKIAVKRRLILRGDAIVPLGGRAFDTLVMLLRHAGEVVSSDALRAAIWPGLVVADSNLAVHIVAIRRALGQHGRTDLITVARRGYSFTGPAVRIVGETGGGSASGREEEPVETVAVSGSGNLRAPIGRLFGRQDDVQKLLSLMDNSSLISIVGTAGVGKTRLALELGAVTHHRFPDGVWFVDLAPLVRPDLICESIRTLFGLPTAALDNPHSVLAAFFASKQLLLILDNCEHLIGKVAGLVSAILPGGRGLRIIATSRERLAITKEAVYRLNPLKAPDQHKALSAKGALDYEAVGLFADRAGALSGFVLKDEDAAAVGAICRQLDGIPLAIELAAARMAILTPSDLLGQLRNRFRLLRREDRLVTPRQRALQAAIEWSYDLLEPAGQRAFDLLSVFGGSFTIAAVSHVLGVENPDAIDLLSSLVEKSLVVRVAESAGTSRFALLETMREYAAFRLLQWDPGDGRRRLAQYMCDLLRHAEITWATTGTSAWLQLYKPEIDNFRTGLSWAFGPDGDEVIGVRLAAYGLYLWRELFLIDERVKWVDLAIGLIDDKTPPDIEARLLLSKASAFRVTIRLMTPSLQRALSLMRQQDDPLLLAQVLAHAALSLCKPGDVASAEPLFLEAMTLLQPHGVTKQLCQLLDFMAFARILMGDLKEAKPLIEQGLALGRMLEFPRNTLNLTNKRAEIAFAEGEIEAALEYNEDAIRSAAKRHDLDGLLLLRSNRIGYLVSARKLDQAWIVGREALLLAQTLGHGGALTVGVIEHLALAIALRGNGDNAARLAGYCEAYRQSIKYTRDPADTQIWRDLLQQLAVLSPTDQEQLFAEGAGWNSDQVVSIMLSLVP